MATRGDFSLQSHEQIKNRIFERRRKLTKFLPFPWKARHAVQTHAITPREPSGHVMFTPRILSRSNGSESGRVITNKLREKSDLRIFKQSNKAKHTATS